jgi:5-methylcytosine-specific restriction endonuclease McrA
MDARGKGVEPILWQHGYRPGECVRCGSKSALMVYWVVPHRRTEANPWAYWPRWSTMTVRCLDADACAARTRRAYEARSRRSGLLTWRCSRFESPNLDLPKGTCRWCGEAIVYTEDADYRCKKRERHRGDEQEVGDRDCRREYERSWCWQGRSLVQLRGDPCCVWCGVAEEWHDPGDGSEGWWLPAQWEADHVVPLEDGGAHCPTNIARCCVPCHKAKTKAENRARADRRRVDKAQPAA